MVLHWLSPHAQLLFRVPGPVPQSRARPPPHGVSVSHVLRVGFACLIAASMPMPAYCRPTPRMYLTASGSVSVGATVVGSVPLLRTERGQENVHVVCQPFCLPGGPQVGLQELGKLAARPSHVGVCDWTKCAARVACASEPKHNANTRSGGGGGGGGGGSPSCQMASSPYLHVGLGHAEPFQRPPWAGSFWMTR